MDARGIAQADKPVLLIDTCSILDVMRDPTRKVPIHERRAGLDLLEAAESGALVGIVARQVTREFAEHDRPIQEEAIRALRGFRKQLEQLDQLNQWSGILGAPGPGPLSLDHLDDHVSRTREVVERWLTQLIRYDPDVSVLEKAIARMESNIAPAARGKESTKDCIVFETYLKSAEMLRAEGHTAPIVFLSSNTKEYLTTSRVLKNEIESDLAPLRMFYAQNMSLAKHQLGL